MLTAAYKSLQKNHVNRIESTWALIPGMHFGGLLLHTQQNIHVGPKHIINRCLNNYECHFEVLLRFAILFIHMDHKIGKY